MLVAHVVISLLAIVLGLGFFAGLLSNRDWPALTALFLLTNILTSLSGIPLPADRFLPSHAFVILCLIALGLACYGRYVRGLQGSWRRVYVVGSLFALYLNVVVLIVQTFDKIDGLPQPLGGACQLAALVSFLVLGRRALASFSPSPGL